MFGPGAKMENTPVDIRNFMMKEQQDNKMIRKLGQKKEQQLEGKMIDVKSHWIDFLRSLDGLTYREWISLREKGFLCVWLQ